MSNNPYDLPCTQQLAAELMVSLEFALEKIEKLQNELRELKAEKAAAHEKIEQLQEELLRELRADKAAKSSKKTPVVNLAEVTLDADGYTWMAPPITYRGDPNAVEEC